MSVHKVRQIGDPVLRSIAKPVPKDFLRTDEFLELKESMVKTMRATKGVGIAAPQIGTSLQVFAIEFLGHSYSHYEEDLLREMETSVVPLKVFVNPKIKVIDSKIVEFYEGCLSIRGRREIVPRYRGVELEAMDENGEEVTWKAYGWPARIIQHEVDHLNGNLYIDRLNS